MVLVNYRMCAQTLDISAKPESLEEKKGKKKEVNPNHPVFRCSDQIQNLSRQLQSVGRQT